MSGMGMAIGLWALNLLLSANPYHLAPEQAFVFECTVCHMEFLLPREDAEILRNSMGPMGVVKHCPLCQGNALWAIPCVDCRANIIKPADSICPDCGVDIQEALNRKVQAAVAKKAAQRAQQARLKQQAQSQPAKPAPVTGGF